MIVEHLYKTSSLPPAVRELAAGQAPAAVKPDAPAPVVSGAPAAGAHPPAGDREHH